MPNTDNANDQIFLNRAQQPQGLQQGQESRGPTRDRVTGLLPSITLPKGGGAIRGIGEKFAANPVTGTGSMSVPIATSLGRSGFGPQLSLSYDSGSGNGPFGFGWNLSLPSITRKTDKGLPKYQDEDESDTFILSGAEDLVPVLKQKGNDWVPEDVPDRTIGIDTYRIKRYRPRIEGLFARIERWTNIQSNETHWRSISRDNITTAYGQTAASRIEDPSAPEGSPRVFSWLICESYDDKGNAIYYEYEPEDSAGIDLSQTNERNRTAKSRSSNRYLKRIKYGNKTPVEHDSNLPREFREDLSERTDWLFEVVFDYEEGHYEELPADPNAHQFVNAHKDPTQDRQRRQDPSSSYRAGFEVRTYRLCHRILMFHHFPDELGVDDYLVRSTEFKYQEGHIASFITSITQSGFKRQDDGTYLKKSLPPLEFEYSRATIQDKVEDVDEESLENLPQGLDGTQYQWADIDGEGLSGILTEQGDSWFYKRNVSTLPVIGEDGKPQVVARFAPTERLDEIPSFTNLSEGRQQLLDLAGDGQLDVVEFDSPTPGFYERTKDEGWNTFRPFETLPNISWQDPDLKFVDLTGDGHADIFITEDEAFTWYPSLAEKGFASGEKVRQALDEEKGPKLLFADGTQSIYLADISGDGLTDLVRIRNGEVCYWPNLGYGRFGAKVMMDNSPHFDAPDQFDQRRIRLADIDGSGVTDIIYFKEDGVYIYLNESGNRWADAEKLKSFPKIDNLSSVIAVDLLGNGTACLVWSSPLPGHACKPMRYIDLMGGQKPHLLVKTVNNLGAETHIHYAPSTKFYLADKEAGKPWITRIPFPVHVVERVETFDRISRNRFVTRYAYHHGYFDGIEREFRGFGMVEQWDTEEYAKLEAGSELEKKTNWDAASHVPPVLTRTWFHTGAYLGRNHISNFFAGLLDANDIGEYYREPGLTDAQARELLLEDTVLPDGLTVKEEREACRALKGAMLRQEVYALDGTDKEPHPYTVTEQNFTICVLQPREDNRHAVFFTHAREAINYHYERNPADPRIQHSLTLEVDDYGNVLKEAAIGYGRRQPDMDLSAEDRAKQTQILITYTENRVTNAIEATDDYRTPLPCEIRTYELTGIKPENNAARFSFNEWTRNGFALLASSAEIPYEQTANNVSKQKRLIEHVRTLYRKDDLTAFSPLGEVEPLALSGEAYKLAFPPGLLTQVYQRNGQPLLPDPASVLGGQGPDQGGYVDLDNDGQWWIPSGRAFHSPGIGDTAAQELVHARQHFFLTHRYRDPFGQTTTVVYDAYDLLLLETRDPVGNRVTVGERDAAGNITVQGNDYRMLQPTLMSDPNRNRAAVAFDALGMVVGTAVMGKPEENLGDSLDGFVADLIEAVILDHLTNALTNPTAILSRATTRLVYDLFAYLRTKDQPDPQPAVVYTLARETHDAVLEPGQQTKVQHSFSYSDGFGREIQKKIQAEPGPVPKRDAEGKIIVEPDGQPQMTENDVSPRWVGSGWTVFNNKGKTVRRYEPFFTDTHRFEFDVRIGVSPTLFYDPAERVIATLHPNHTYEKVVFDPWHQETWDVNDTVLQVDPRNDVDVGGFFDRISDSDYLPSWYDSRINGQKGPAEKSAAEKAALHNGTPAIAFFDSLGRTFLTVADNGQKGKYKTRTHLDIEGNQRMVIDAKERIVMQYDYDMLGNRIHQVSMEAGERWMLNDVAGKPIYGWNSRGHRTRITYDELQRPTGLYVSANGGPEVLAEKTVYGESLPNPEQFNHRGRIYQVYDGAGVVTNEMYDFKGNQLSSRRQLLQDYRNQVDWAQSPSLEPEIFTGNTQFDALNRAVQIVAPHSNKASSNINIIQPTYNEANLLEHVDVWLGEGVIPQALLDPATANLHAVKDIDYDAKGQRSRIEYGNSVITTYEYDPYTFRLIRLKTVRHGGDILQDLQYTYDPAGNITSIRDHAQQTIYFNNTVVEPRADYTYDALYRLIEATGREHIGQVSRPETSWNDKNRTGLSHPNDGRQMRVYTEKYEYDEVGNILNLIHLANGNGNWTRAYSYNEASLIEPGKKNNRLSSTTVGDTTVSYEHDEHGNMTRMPHLPAMEWDFEDQLHVTQRQVVNNGNTAERTYYVYDAEGERVRKVTERQDHTPKYERIYLGGFEIYRDYKADGTTIELERKTLHITDDRQRIAMIETKTIDTNNDPTPGQLIRYQMGNHLGSAGLELDDTGRVISYEEYYPYGSTSYQAVDKNIRAAAKRYRYTGKERDEETGLYYHGARYYACWLGRWTAADPEGLVDGVNLYGYVRANPLRLSDPNGTQGRNEMTGEGYNIGLHLVPNVTSPPPSKRRRGKQKKPIFYEYFSEVVPATLRAIEEYNASHKKKISMNKALFLITQAYGEQSPRKVGLPSKNENRLFNAHAEVKRNTKGDITGVKSGQESEGVRIINLKQGEGATDATRILKSSPTFAYDSPERSVSHTLSIFEKRYSSVHDVLTNQKGTFQQYTNALDSVKYATDINYGLKLRNIQQQVKTQVKAWVVYRLKELPEEIRNFKKNVLSLEKSRSNILSNLELLESLQGIGEIDTTIHDEKIRLTHIERRLSIYRSAITSKEAELTSLKRFEGVLKN